MGNRSVWKRSSDADFLVCLDYISRGGTNDNGRFYWHTATPSSSSMTPQTTRQHRLSDTGIQLDCHAEKAKGPTELLCLVLSTPSNSDSVWSTSVSSISTEFGTMSPTHHPNTIPPSPHNTHRPHRTCERFLVACDRTWASFSGTHASSIASESFAREWQR